MSHLESCLCLEFMKICITHSVWCLLHGSHIHGPNEATYRCYRYDENEANEDFICILCGWFHVMVCRLAVRSFISSTQKGKITATMTLICLNVHRNCNGITKEKHSKRWADSISAEKKLHQIQMRECNLPEISIFLPTASALPMLVLKPEQISIEWWRKWR